MAGWRRSSFMMLRAKYAVGSGHVVALTDVELSVDAHEFVVVLGPSGSGKTTLLNMIGALDTPTRGEIRIAGNRLSGASRRDLARYRRATVGFVFQTFNLFPSLTALENVEFGLDVARHQGGIRRVTEVLDAGRPRRPIASLPEPALRR